MKAVVFAYQEIGCVCLEELLKQGVEVTAVITHPDDPDEKIWFRSVLSLAKKNKIPVFETGSVKEGEWLEKVAGFKPDVIFSFMFRRLLPEGICKCAPLGAFNLHPSLLPKYRGRCPANWVLVNGETGTGLTMHEMVKKADAGVIIAQERVAIGPDDDIADLYKKLVQKAPVLLRAVLPGINDGTCPRTIQDESKATKFGGRTPSDGMFEWNWDPGRIHNLVRAVTHPYPGAFFQNDRKSGRKLFVWKTRNSQSFRQDESAVCGRIISLSPLTVSVGGASIELVRLQWEGEDELPAPDFIRKYGLKVKEDIALNRFTFKCQNSAHGAEK